MKVVVLGAGVIGQIYAARLVGAGNDVTVIARGERLSQLQQNGVRLQQADGKDQWASPRIASVDDASGPFDQAIITVRRDQLDRALPEIARINAPLVTSLINLPLGYHSIAGAIGARRYVPAFPGVAGRITSEGEVVYRQVRHQPTTLGQSSGSAQVERMLVRAGFATAIEPDMLAWFQVHTVFITAFESAILSAGGDTVALSKDRTMVRTVVLAIRHGLAALSDRGVRITPESLRLIFQRMPVWFATVYWKRQLAGEFGNLELAPHALASRRTELPALEEDVLAILDGAVPNELKQLIDTARAL